jgi:NAD(P)-dependent dehydrogenase (short-subunit alcohol dehydrogenase family)
MACTARSLKDNGSITARRDDKCPLSILYIMEIHMSSFEDKVAIITGGSAGIGLAAAKLLASKGARVLITGRRANVLQEIASASSNILGLVADASDPEAASKTVAAAIDKWGRLDILINNAGGGAIQPLGGVDVQTISEIYSVNVVGPVLLTAAAVPHLAKTKGAVVNMSSTFGSKVASGLSLYGSSKAAIEYLTRAWAIELAPFGIRVNAIAPGPVETNFLRERMRLSDDEIRTVKDQELRKIPLGRRGDPKDVAPWIVALAEPATTWVTGQILAVDGGLVNA